MKISLQYSNRQWFRHLHQSWAKGFNLILASVLVVSTINAQSGITDFAAKANQAENEIQLDWITVAGFEAENVDVLRRNSDTDSWMRIGSVECQESGSPEAYSFLDAHPNNNLHYYRLSWTINKRDFFVEAKVLFDKGDGVANYNTRKPQDRFNSKGNKSQPGVFDFNGKVSRDGNGVDLSWYTQPGFSAENIEVYRKNKDTEVWNPIGSVETIESPSTREYAFSDSDPQIGVNYYILSWKDAQVMRSQEIKVIYVKELTEANYDVRKPQDTFNTKGSNQPGVIDFNGKVSKDGNGVDLSWYTQPGFSAENIEVQRKNKDTQVYSTIGSVETIESPSTREYAFSDSDPQTGVNYYILSWKDAQVMRSQEIKVIYEKELTEANYEVRKPQDTFNTKGSNQPGVIDFNGKVSKDGNGVDLSWYTQPGFSAENIEVQRKNKDTQVYSTIGSVETIESPSTREYAFSDSDPQTGVNYYILSWKDAQVMRSQEIKVIYEKELTEANYDVRKPQDTFNTKGSNQPGVIDFNGTVSRDGNGVQLSWYTQPGFSADNVDVQRKNKDTQVYYTIGSVEISESASPIKYAFVDNDAQTGPNYYILTWKNPEVARSQEIKVIYEKELTEANYNVRKPQDTFNTKGSNQPGVIDFNGKVGKDGSGVDLTWFTQPGFSVENIDVQRKNRDNETYFTIGSVETIESATSKEYAFSDNEPQTGANYYILSWKDGAVFRSQEIKVIYEKVITEVNYSTRNPHMIEFRADYDKVNDEVDLSWTASGFNTDSYAISYSLEGTDWKTFLNVDSESDGVTPAVYERVHPNPPTGLLYYKLSCEVAGEIIERSVAVEVPTNTPDGSGLTNAKPLKGDLVSQSRGVAGHVDLRRFDAGFDQRADKVILKWTTSSESDNNFFNVYRSKDRLNWTEVTTVAGSGTTNGSVDYSCNDAKYINGKSYYKLEWLRGGEFEYSIAEVRVIGTAADISRNMDSDVELRRFVAGFNRTTSKLTLKWTTSSEKENNFFNIYRSKDRLNWIEVATVPGSGTTSESKDYSFVDGEYLNGKSFYKLEWISGTEMKFAIAEIRAIGNATTISRKANSVNFKAQALKDHGNVLVTWAVDGTGETAIYKLNRSTDGENWTEVVIVEDKTKAGKKAIFEYTDEAVEPGNAYYRLEWFDEFGNRNSSILSMNVPEKAVEYRGYPNPTVGVTRISADEPISTQKNVRVVSIDGQKYDVPFKYDAGQIEFDLSQIPHGIYMIQLDNGFVRVHKN